MAFLVVFMLFVSFGGASSPPPYVVGQGHPTELHLDFFLPSQVESLKAEILFDMTKYTLHVRFSVRVECSSEFTFQFERFFRFEFLVNRIIIDLPVAFGGGTVRFEWASFTGLTFIDFKVPAVYLLILLRQTNVYLLALASILVPSIKIVSSIHIPFLD